MPGGIPTEEEVLGYFSKLSNWGRWGDDDQMGTLNFLTPEKRRRALAVVKDGITISCGRTITTDQAPDSHPPPIHYMVQTGEGWDSGQRPVFSRDWFGMAVHGTYSTHLDAVSHQFWEGTMYNGHPARLVNAEHGATAESVELVKDGIVTRGVLVDMPLIRGVEWMEPGEAVMPEDILAAEERCDFRIEEGDALIIRMGQTKKRNVQGPYDLRALGHAGCQAACLPLFHERSIALLGADVNPEASPTGYPSIISPIHSVGMVAMGLWIMDNADLEELATQCQARNRWQFLIAVCPLPIRGGTGSPVNPIAVL